MRHSGTRVCLTHRSVCTERYVRRVDRDGLDIRHRPSETNIVELIAAYCSDITAKALAERYGVHYSTIKNNLRQYGVTRGAGKTD